MIKPSRLGRPPDRKKEIFVTLLQRIVLGHYPPASRLPTRLELCQELDASPVTVQAAFADLTRVGFIESHGRLGTFVKKTPPHLQRLAVISFDSKRTDSRVYALLRREAQQMKKEGWALNIIDFPTPPFRGQSLSPLEVKVRNHQFAGLLFLRPPNHLMDSDLIREPGIPRVILTHALRRFPGCYCVSPAPLADFFNAAAKEILHLGKKRVALFMHTDSRGQLESARDILRQAGLEVHQAWVHGVNILAPEESLPILELIFMLPPQKRPDFFLVSDDNLTELVTLGVKKFAPPNKRPAVMSICNFPGFPKTHRPVHWLGYDLRELIVTAIGLIANARRNIPNPHRLIRLPPCTEEYFRANRGNLSRSLVGPLTRF